MKPNKIIIPIQFDPMIPYYDLQVRESDVPIERISLQGIHGFIEELNQKERNDCVITYWVPDRLAYKVEWRINGEEFMERSEIKIIDEYTRYE